MVSQWVYSERRYGKDLVLNPNPLAGSIRMDASRHDASESRTPTTIELEQAIPARIATGGYFTA